MDISVIIPAYNVENYLPLALDSIISQDFEGTFEILIANDASTDGTLDVIRRYEQQYPQTIRVLNRAENMGVSANYVDLARMSDAKYLAFCDSDDYWIDTKKLQNEYAVLESDSDAGMVCSAAKVISPTNPAGTIVEVPYATSLSDLLNQPEDIFCSNILCRRDLFDKMIEECEWYIERNWFYDTIWSYWFAYHSKVEYIPEALSVYRVSEESDSHSNDNNRRYQLVRRNYLIKMHFMLSTYHTHTHTHTHTHGAPHEGTKTIESVLSQEYDYMLSYAVKMAKEEVRNSTTYKIGKFIKKYILWSQ